MWLSYQVTIRKADVLLSHTPAPVTPPTPSPNKNAFSRHPGFSTARKHISRTWRPFLPSSGSGRHAEASDHRDDDVVVLRLALSGAYVRMGLRNDKGLEMDGAVNNVAVYGAGGAEVFSIHPSALWAGVERDEGMEQDKSEGNAG